jgi:hypothetical protein
MIRLKFAPLPPPEWGSAPGTNKVTLEEIHELSNEMKITGLINELSRFIGERIHLSNALLAEHAHPKLSQDAFEQHLYHLMQTVRDIERVKRELLEAVR